MNVCMWAQVRAQLIASVYSDMHTSPRGTVSKSFPSTYTLQLAIGRPMDSFPSQLLACASSAEENSSYVTSAIVSELP